MFFLKTDTFMSKLISRITNSEYSHVGIIVGYNEETQVATVIESDRFVETRVNSIVLSDDLHVVFSVGDMTDETRDNVVEYAFRSVGKKYDYFQIIGLFFSLLFKRNRFAYFNSANKLICSELIDMAYLSSGVTRRHSKNIGNITPQELLELYDFTMIKKGV